MIDAQDISAGRALQSDNSRVPGRWRRRLGVLAISLAVAYGALAQSSGCDRQAARTKSPTSTVARTPQSEFREIQAYFARSQGNLLADNVTKVVWKENSLCRLYECGSYTVVTYPPDWHEEVSEFFIIAGTVRDYNKLRQAFFYDYNSKTYTYSNSNLNLDTDAPGVDQVSFEGFRLGQSKESVIEHQTQWIRENRFRFGKSSESLHQIDLDIDNLTRDPGSASGERGMRPDTTRGTMQFNMFFKEGRLCYMQFIHFTTGRRLEDHADFNAPSSKFIAEGEFSVVSPKP